MERQFRLGRINIPLILGILIVSLVVIVAVKGPDLAPRDPLERNQIAKVGEKYLIPPFPLFTPGFPLGSDQLGRDLLSGLLWAVRPTLTMVALIATIRMTLGVIIGLLAGWDFGRLSRYLDLLIAAAISVPVIIVALGCIAALGIDLGIWVFIVGLSATGWVETARIVREQTQVIHGQVFIEAARSLGASHLNILFRHVLRQIMPLIWMLFAFEISSSLMLTASLGFLGYYVGGDVWVMISDTTAIATSSMPELGQMLATTKTSLAKPWPLFSLGATIFVIVLGFTMLGEGLRQRVHALGVNQNGKLARWGDRARFWMEDKVGYPISQAVRSRTFAYVIAGILLVAAAGGGYVWRLHQQNTQKTIPPAFFEQAAVWASAKHDPYGTQWSSTVGPRDNTIAWTLEIPGYLGGGPAIGADGTVYIVTVPGELLAVEPLGGNILWRHPLPAAGVGTPGIDPQGVIYAADAEGGISAVRPDGSLKWYYQPAQVNSAITGPVIAPDGTIYYTVRGILRAVSAEGSFLWESFLQDIYAVRETPRLSPDGKIVYTSNAAFNTADGAPLEFPSLGKVERYFTGADGEIYATTGHRIFHWKNSQPAEEMLRMITWDFQKFTVSTAPQSAGAAPDGSFWMFYTGFSRRFGTGEDTRVVWLDAKGKILGNAHYGTRNSQVIAIDHQAVMFTCGNLDLGFGALECQAFARENPQPLWTMVMERGVQALGGALADNRLYIAADGDGTGILFAIGNGAAGTTLSDSEAAKPAVKQTDTAESSSADLLALTSGRHSSPQNPQPSLIYEDEKGFAGNVAVAADGTIYIPSLSRGILAMNTDGTALWERALAAKPAGTPIIGEDGTIYTTDTAGWLYTLNAQGEILWQFQTAAEPLRALSGPALGPDGTIYYTVGAAEVQAVSPSGEGLWSSKVGTAFFYRAPRPSLDGKYVYFHEEIFDAKTGESLPTGLEFQIKQFFDGKDGSHYLFTATTVVAWSYQNGRVVLSNEKVLSNASNAMHAGVESAGITWIAYPDQVLWFSRDGKALANVGVKNSWLEKLAGVDGNGTVILCGRRPRQITENNQPFCAALSPAEKDPLWELAFGKPGEFTEGCIMMDGGIYVSTDQGRLYLLKDHP